jgi:hypothetical protein
MARRLRPADPLVLPSDREALLPRSEVCAKASIADGCDLIGKWRACSSSTAVDMKVAEAPVGGLGGPRISKRIINWSSKFI